MVLFSGIPKNPRCPLFLHLLFSGEVKENMTRWVRNLRIWGFGWLSIALAHFPFSWLDRTKSQPTQIKRTEHLRAHYLLISKNSPRGLPLEHLISIHLAVRLRGGAGHCLWPLCNQLGSGEKTIPPHESDLILQQQVSITSNCFLLKGRVLDQMTI